MDASELIQRLVAGLAGGREQPASHVLVQEVWLAVVEGELTTGQRLPTVRKLAIELGINPRTVERAYEELERLGVVSTRMGEGSFVSLSPPPEEERERRRAFQDYCVEVVAGARKLGFSLEELLDALSDFRDTERNRSIP
ncbi:MAG: GntR family transcriptional regulator [Gemmatimonadota bacterium]